MMDSWVTWALQGLITAILVVVWQRLETNTRAVTALALQLAENYVKMTEWEAMRGRLHDIEDWISGQKAIEHLKRFKGEA